MNCKANITDDGMVEVSMSKELFAEFLLFQSSKELPQAGEIFTRGGIEFVALGMEQGGILAVAADVLEYKMAFDKDGCNDWRKSSLRKYLNEEFVKNFEEGDLLPFVSDLIAEDGTTGYGFGRDRIALLSENLCRKYRRFIPGYHTEVWTITPRSCSSKRTGNHIVRVVDDTGLFWGAGADICYGVIPACIFNPEIFKESEEKRFLGEVPAFLNPEIIKESEEFNH